MIALSEALEDMLYRDWDPIGVSHFDGPRDEYRAYVADLVTHLALDAEPARIAAYLHAIERDWITVETSAEHRLAIAHKAKALFAAFRH